MLLGSLRTGLCVKGGQNVKMMTGVVTTVRGQGAASKGAHMSAIDDMPLHSGGSVPLRLLFISSLRSVSCMPSAC
jgi:hypothetical protein